MNLRERIQAGIEGKFSGLSNGFTRINDYLFGIQKSTYYLLGGQSGSGKTTLVDYMVFNAIKDAANKGIKLNVFYYSYEIDRLSKECNWLSMLIFNKYQVVISPEKIKGLGPFRLNTEEQKLVYECISEVEEMFNQIHFEFTPINPTGIYRQCWKFLENTGVFIKEKYLNEDGEEKEKIVKFIPNDPNEITLGVIDHLYHLKKERDYDVKLTIDKFSEYCIQLKNLFGMSWICIQQFNRALSSVERMKFSGVQLSPEAADFKDTGNTYQDKINIEKYLTF